MAQLQVVNPFVEFITPKYFPDWKEQSLRLIEECGRVSHKSEKRIKDGSALPFIEKIAINYGHESILEHASFTACFIGSRAMSHQLVRHRLAAYTQESQRYCDYGKRQDTLKVIIPPTIGKYSQGSLIRKGVDNELEIQPIPCRGWVKLDNDSKQFFLSLLDSYEEYLAARERGIPAEDARHLLPNACKTEVYTTFNFRQWRHLFTMRLDKHAQWEIKACVQQVFNYFKEHIPLLISNLRTHSGDPLE